MAEDFKYRLLEKLLPRLAEYESQAGEEADLGGFGSWLKTREQDSKQTASGQMEAQRAIRLSMLLTWMYRFAKTYTKKGLENSAINNPDDFTFLATLLFEGPMSQSDLARQHLLEVSSTAEVLRRLQAANWVVKKPHPDDGRVKQYAITSAGQQEYLKTQPAMMQVAYLIGGDLSDEKLDQLAALLEDLNAFHQKLYEQAGNLEFDTQLSVQSKPNAPA